jgi:LL-diaminopimelate aminotransferase
VFGVDVDPVHEVNHAIGSKPAYAIIPGLFINPGDVTLMTVPGYPVAGTYTKYFGGAVHPMPLLRRNNFLPDFDELSDEVRQAAKLMVLNYPNSPTGALADHRFFDRVVRFAKENKIVVINDAAHILLTYGQRPLSFLEIDGARDVGLEVHSMSKGYNMIGWRLGFVTGNPLLVRAFADFKDNTDSGQFIAIQKAGAVALDNVDIPEQIRTKYERRLRKLIAALNSTGAKVEMPGGTYFLYVPSPQRARTSEFLTAEDASQFLIKEHSIVTVPWDDAGAFLRFSVTYQAATEEVEDALMSELVARLRSAGIEW